MRQDTAVRHPGFGRLLDRPPSWTMTRSDGSLFCKEGRISGRLRSRHYRRRDQRRGPRGRRPRPRFSRRSHRAERSRLRHFLSVVEAHSWRLALSRTAPIPPGPRGAARARSAVARRAASDPAAALRAADQRIAAFAGAVAARAVDLLLDRLGPEFSG